MSDRWPCRTSGSCAADGLAGGHRGRNADGEGPRREHVPWRWTTSHPAAGGEQLARRYLAEVGPHLSCEALRFVATELGVRDQAQFRADLLVQIRGADLDAPPVPAPPSLDSQVNDLLARALLDWQCGGDARTQPEVIRACFTDPAHRPVVRAWLESVDLGDRAS